MSVSLDSQFSSQLSSQDGELAADANAGIHVRSLRLYEDFQRLANLESAPARLMEIVAHAKNIANNQSQYDVAVVIAALRRKATAHLILNQARRALSTAEHIIRLKFDWPYGHLVKADALLGMGQYAGALNAYQLAEQLMPRHDPTDDFARSEVVEQMQLLQKNLAAKSCVTMTVAHECEVTAIAGWPPKPLKRRRSHKRLHTSAAALQDSVNCAVNDALEAISRDGGMSHVQLHTAGTAQPAHAAPEAKSLDQLLADQLLAGGSRRRMVSGGHEEGSDGGARGEFTSMLDTSVSSTTDGHALRTSTSEIDFKTHASSFRSPSTLHAAEGAPESVQSGDAPAGLPPPAPRPPSAPARQQMNTQNSAHSSEAASSRSLPGSYTYTDGLQPQFLATGDIAGGLKLWDVNRLECANALAGHATGISCITFASDLRKGCVLLMASADAAGVVIIWALDIEGSLFESHRIEAHGNRVVAMKFVNGGRRLVTSSVDTTIAVWNVVTGRNEQRLDGHRRAVMAMDVITIHSSVIIASCSVNGSWCLWDLDAGKPMLKGKQAGACGHVRFTPCCVALTPPRPLLVTCHYSVGRRRGTASIHLWDVFAAGGDSGSRQPCHSFTGVARCKLTAVAFTVDQAQKALMAVASDDGSLIIFDLLARSVLTHLSDVHKDAVGASPPTCLKTCVVHSFGKPTCLLTSRSVRLH